MADPMTDPVARDRPESDGRENGPRWALWNFETKAWDECPAGYDPYSDVRLIAAAGVLPPDTLAKVRAVIDDFDNDTALPPRPTQYRRGWADAHSRAATRLRLLLLEAASGTPGPPACSVCGIPIVEHPDNDLCVAPPPAAPGLREALLRLVNETYFTHHTPSRESGPEEWDATYEAPSPAAIEVALRALYPPVGVPAATPDDLPKRVVVGANGAYWREYDDHYSMCPVSDDNDPVVPVAVYVRAALGEPE